MNRQIRSTGRLTALLCLCMAGVPIVSFSQEDARPTFQGVVQPLLKKHCYDCHSGEQADGQLDLTKLEFDFSSDENSQHWIDIMHAVRFGDMPPPDEPQPTSDEKAKIVDSVFQQMVASGRFEAYRTKLLSPEFGNWVDHEKLFSGEINLPPYSPARLWRFSPEIFASKGFGNAKSPYT